MYKANGNKYQDEKVAAKDHENADIQLQLIQTQKNISLKFFSYPNSKRQLGILLTPNVSQLISSH